MKAKKQQVDNTNLWLAIPIALIAGLIPLIVRLSEYVLPKDAAIIWGERDFDLFSYNKAMYIIGLTVVLIICFLIKLSSDGKIKFQPIFYPIFAYSLLVIMSVPLSEHATIAVLGFPSRYEGMLVLVSYVSIMFITANIVVEEKQIKLIWGAIFASSCIIGIIGVFQYFGLDFFRSGFARYIMLPVKYLDLNLQFNFGKNTIYATLFNTNNVGSYAAMLFPISLCFYIFISKKNYKIFFGLLSCIMFILWIGCQSLMGNIGGVAALILMAVFWGKKIIKEYKYVLPAVGAYIVLLFVMNYFGSGALSQNASKVNGPVGQDALIDVKQGKPDELTIVTRKTQLKVVYDKSELSFLDKNNKVLDLKKETDDKNPDEMKLVINDDTYGGYDVKLNEKKNNLKIVKSNVNFDLALTDKGICFMDKGYAVPQPKIEMVDVKGKEAFGSGRFYIWSRAIPLMKKTLIIGNGPDTFPFFFPQNDYIGKLKGLLNQNILVDKPHNMYLSMGINTGVLSLLAFIVFVLMYYITTIRFLWKREIDNLWLISSASILTAVTGYLFAAIGNDSIVSVAPIFWVLIGTGIAINMTYKEIENKVLKNKFARR